MPLREVAIVSLVVLSGCHREHSSPAALPSANSVLTGHVTMTGDLAGASPAGITVSSSGQVATTDGAGNCTFIGINSVGGGMVLAESNGLQFSFSRQSDGISATGSVAVNAASVSVQLQKHSATMVSTGQQKHELEGKITKISDSSITVHNASTDKDVTAKITDSTVIRHGNTTIKAADLKAGQQVHVKTSGSGDSLTATEIIVQN